MPRFRLLLVIPLLFLSACEKKTKQVSGPMEGVDAMLEMELEEEFGHPMREGVPSGKPRQVEPGQEFTLEVLDDSANPAFARRLLTTDQIATGWIALFDGETLFGWIPDNQDVNWKVEHGAITADVGPVGMLRTSVPFADFEFTCEFKIGPGGNSGVFLRAAEHPQNLTQDCIEINIADEHPEGYTTGSLVERAKPLDVAPPTEDWQTMRVTANRSLITVEVNDVLTAEYRDPSPEARKVGYIGLQQRLGKVEFRKVNLKPLAMKGLLNSSSLAGWREVPGSKAKFVPDPDALQITGGLGFLETEETFQNFIFQTQARTGAPEVNTGVFYRTEPGTEKAPSNGYEVQIHNGFHGSNRDQPNNAGSGAIFRRVDARRVVANDQEWFTLTLVANGPRAAVWIDGFQVVDWIDERPADPNPRKGLRLEGGHISLQGHDPTTLAAFRHMRIAEYPAVAP
ncbi:3-keto-disaccharide hydrolase [Planctomicrobium sp. SH661]|uniref:3-keto-disaccharide hydrolase n=1 Tax=Planctomicrobium sp. SH661 TaxID=3448124 RepID=UPI003F5B98B9